jgi:hypothetical protein
MIRRRSSAPARKGGGARYFIIYITAGPQFTSFTSTKVQILTLARRCVLHRRARERRLLRHTSYTTAACVCIYSSRICVLILPPRMGVPTIGGGMCLHVRLSHVSAHTTLACVCIYDSRMCPHTSYYAMYGGAHNRWRQWGGQLQICVLIVLLHMCPPLPYVSIRQHTLAYASIFDSQTL